VDYKDNLALLPAILDKDDYSEDTILLAGDITDHLDKLQQTFQIFTSRFKRVFFVPGNHELWIRNLNYNSMMKFHNVLECAKQMKVQTDPEEVFINGEDGSDSVWIVPLFSWYDKSLSIEIEGMSDSTEGWTDDFLCKFPDNLLESNETVASRPLTEHFLKMNQSRIRQYDKPVISFSHFYSRYEQFLNFEYRGQFRKPLFNFSIVCGSALLQTQLNILKPVVHGFGHSHRRYDFTVDHCRYINNPLGYPQERASAISSPFVPIKLWGLQD